VLSGYLGSCRRLREMHPKGILLIRVDTSSPLKEFKVLRKSVNFPTIFHHLPIIMKFSVKFLYMITQERSSIT